MKEFYVMNLDLRRIAIIAGGALTVLGLCLFIGMAIGRGQGERNARIANEELEQKKLGLTPEPQKTTPDSGDKMVMAAGPSAAVPSVPSVPEAKSEIPLRADPLVAGPPRKKHNAETVEKPVRKRRATAKAKAKEEPEVSGRIEHAARPKRKSKEADESTAETPASAAGRYTIQVAAFKRASEADTLIAKLKGEGIKARSEKTGNFYLVTVGRTKSKEKLEKALARLKELEYEAYIRKIKAQSEDT